MGYLFIGLALITLLSANWEDIPRAVRLSGLLLLTAGTHLFALKKYKDNKSQAAIGLFFMGSLFYGVSIMLIAQIYHIDEHYPNGILWWAIGVLPLAIILESTLLVTLSTALSIIWFFVETGLNYYPALFPIFLGMLGWHIFRVKHSYVLFLTFIIGIGLWAEYSLAWAMSNNYQFRFEAEHFIFLIGMFVIFQGFSKWLLVQKNQMLIDYGTILGLWVLRFGILFLLFASFDWLWEELINANWENTGFTIVLAIVCSGIGILLSFHGNKQFYSTLAFSLIFIIGTYSVIQVQNDIYALYFQIVTNIVLVIAGIWLIIRGIKENITHYFFLGVGTILFTGLLRYIDLVGDYIGAAILFIIFAVILLSAARFWKTHHKQEQRT